LPRQSGSISDHWRSVRHRRAIQGSLHGAWVTLHAKWES